MRYQGSVLGPIRCCFWTRPTPLHGKHTRLLSSVPVEPPTPQRPPQAADEEANAKLNSVLSHFNAPIRFAVAYGSGVFKQKGYSKNAKPPMVDFIFGVTHPEHWHSLNLRQNRHHYSAVGALGSQGVSLIQERIGAGMYYNPDVEIDGMRIKYGVVSMDRLFRDLTEWETLYLAGRLHKPVKIIRDDARISLGMRANLRAAVRTALLLLPNQFTEEELFHTIAGLSYKGDFRMRFGENPHKVYNIVFTQMDAFRALYKPVIDHIPNVNYIDENTLTQEDNVRLRGRLVDKLPKSMHLKVQHYHTAYMARAGKQAEIPPDEPLLSQSIATSPAVSQYVEKALADIVRYPAFTQSIKGFFTAGPSRAFTYVSEKLNKSRAAKGGT